MKFGKEFQIHLEETLPEWRDKFLCYKPLKKLLKNYPEAPLDPTSHFLPNQQLGDDHIDEGTGAGGRPSVDLQDWFVRILNEELEKFNDFYVDKEEDFIIRLQELKERIIRAREKSCRGGALTSQSEFSEEMMNIRKDFVTIHGEMVLLKNYSSLNFAGLVKILKKYDKRTGDLLRLPFTQVALHQPFFTTEPLTRLVHECEANLELLFPLEEEVIESTQNTQENQSKINTQVKTSPTIGEETFDIYRGTLAAMNAIQSLQKASSTCNPLSFSSFLKNQDDDSIGALTAENSGSDSLGDLQSGDETEQKDDRSV